MGYISTIEVRYAETDQMGIAHHSNYAVWFEVARTDFIKAAGISYTTHGMVTKDLKPINVKKEHPEIYRMFENALD